VLDRTTFDWVAAAEVKADEALTLAKQVIADFLDSYEDADSAEPPFFDGTPESTYVESWSTRDLVSSYLPADPVSFDAVERGEIIDAVVDELARDHCSQWSEKPGLPAGAPLLRAYDHQWGEGHVHRFEAGKTACGKKLENCPGDRAWGHEDDITCKACLRLIGRR
jgi:hypothetical protein